VGQEVFCSAAPAELTEVSYRPTRRAVLRAAHGSRVRYLKVLRRDRAAALHARHRMLLAAGLPVPAPVEDPVRDVVVLRQLPGTPLAASVRRDGAAALHPEHVLALLDALPAAALELPARASWTDRVLDYGHAAAVALPEERARIERLATAIDEARRATDPGPVLPVHGDLYEANLLVGPAARGTFGPVTGVLDVDAVGPGHRVDDLACLVAHLAVLPTVHDRYGHAPAAARRLLAGFDAAVDPVALRVRCAGVALSLVAGARRSGGPPDRARRRLEIAEEFLGSDR
jgi:Ser/Thr protein kinase RdoA (MazF antagonist)